MYDDKLKLLYIIMHDHSTYYNFKYEREINESVVS